VIGIRGATTIETDTEEEIVTNTKELLEEIIKANNLDRDKLTAMFFTCTRDIASAYPAKAARQIGFTDIPLMCFQEMHVEGSLKKCIRLCVFYTGEMQKKDVRHIYLKDAKQLRPDLVHF